MTLLSVGSLSPSTFESSTKAKRKDLLARVRPTRLSLSLGDADKSICAFVGPPQGNAPQPRNGPGPQDLESDGDDDNPPAGRGAGAGRGGRGGGAAQARGDARANARRASPPVARAQRRAPAAPRQGGDDEEDIDEDEDDEDPCETAFSLTGRTLGLTSRHCERQMLGPIRSLGQQLVNLRAQQQPMLPSAGATRRRSSGRSRGRRRTRVGRSGRAWEGRTTGVGSL